MSSRRLSVLVSSALLASCASQPAAPPAAPQRPLALEPPAPGEAQSGEPGWLLSGGARDMYAVRRDTAGDRTSWLLEPIADTSGKYGTWMRHIDADLYRDKRVRITAIVKTEGATRRVDFWARAQAKNSPGDGPGLGGDSHPLAPESPWKEETIVMDVPSETAWLEYGVGLAGPGKIWLAEAKLDIVGKDVPLTGKSPKGDTGRDASARGTVPGWKLSGADPQDYAIAVDSQVKHRGKASGSLRSTAAEPKAFATLMQMANPGTYTGKRVRLSATIKSENVKGWAGLWMRVDGPDGRMGGFDNMQDRAIKGTNDWTHYEIVLDVMRDAAAIAFGVLLDGAGQVWMDDVAFEVVSAKVPTTGVKKEAPQNLDFEQSTP